MNGLKIANNFSRSVQVSYFRCLEYVQENLKDLNETNNLSLLSNVIKDKDFCLKFKKIDKMAIKDQKNSKAWIDFDEFSTKILEVYLQIRNKIEEHVKDIFYAADVTSLFFCYFKCFHYIF